jgi:putative MATE family efflux protein
MPQVTTSQTQKTGLRQRDWTRGSVIGNLLLLSWPMVLMESLWVIGQLIDLIWIGRLGSDSLAGVGLANVIAMMIFALDMGVLTGVRAMIARDVGAGNLHEASRVAGQALILGACFGIVITIAGLLSAEKLLGLFGSEPEVVAEGTAYLRIILAGWVASELMLMALYAVQASGDTVTPMIVEAVIRVIHIAICPFLVLGLWIFPRMGVSGAALSNILAQVLGAAIMLWIMFQGRTRLHLVLQDLRVNVGIIWRILKIGIPAVAMNIQSSFGSMLLMRFIVPFGTLAVASHSLSGRVEMFLFVPGMGLGTGSGVLVGQNLGANQPSRAKKSTWLAVVLVEAFMAVCAAAILIWAEYIIGIFSQEAGLISLGADFMRIASAAYLVSGFAMVMQNCIAGAGDTMPNMIVSIVTMWAVQLPLAFWLSQHTNLEIYGIRWAMVISAFLNAAAYTTYFLTGRWMKKRL